MERYKRLQQILNLLREKGSITVEETGELLAISPATVRRDFNYLVSEYRVTKTWGGIVLPESPLTPDTLSIQDRLIQNKDQKTKIAEAAAALVQDGHTLFIDGGTTTLEMIPFLMDKKVKIITNSILIAERVDILNTAFACEVFLTGGMLYPSTGLITGPQATEFIQQFHADWTFLSPGGLSEMGISNSNVLVVETEKAMLARSLQTVVLADSSKIGKTDLLKICDLDEFDHLFTEHSSNDELLQQLCASKVTLHLI